MRLRSEDKHHLRKSADRKAQISPVSGTHAFLICAFRSADFLRWCLSPERNLTHFFFLFPIVFGINSISLLMRFLSHDKRQLRQDKKQKILFKPTIWFHFYMGKKWNQIVGLKRIFCFLSCLNCLLSWDKNLINHDLHRRRLREVKFYFILRFFAAHSVSSHKHFSNFTAMNFECNWSVRVWRCEWER